MAADLLGLFESASSLSLGLQSEGLLLVGADPVAELLYFLLGLDGLEELFF